MKIRLVMLGKTRRAEIRALVDDYLKRIAHYCEIETTELREASGRALKKLKIEPSAAIVMLDAAGKQYSSAEFARWLGGLRDRGARELVFLCGDAPVFRNPCAAACGNASRFPL